MEDDLFFLHEFPNGSSSVLEPCLEDLIATPGVYLVKGPMCNWGMTAKDAEGEGLVKKVTCWVTNSPFIAQELDRECTNASAGLDGGPGRTYGRSIAVIFNFK